jgi:hypothetical protein
LARGVLAATCRTMSQQLRRSALRSVASCVGDIANIDGKLECNQRGVPGGAYLETCTAAAMHDDTLTTSCRTIDNRGGRADREAAVHAQARGTRRGADVRAGTSASPPGPRTRTRSTMWPV